MADVKISALPASTTPLAGTEVLPIVQTGTTKQVSVANLTAGRAVSASSLTLSTPLGVASGGTGLTSLTAGYIPYGNGTGAFSSSANLTFDGSNLGLGVTPSAWDTASGQRAFQMKDYVALWQGANGSSNLAFNTFEYAGNAYKYLGSTFASRYSQLAGEHRWFTAPSGTAGSAISFTQAMTLDASGNLLVGTTSSPSGSNKLRVANSILDDLAIGSGAHFDTSNATPLTVATGSNELLISGSGYYLVLISERNQTGQTALYLLANGTVTLISQNGGSWVTGTTPGASEFSIGSSGGNYRVYNGYTGSATYLFSATIIRCF